FAQPAHRQRYAARRTNLHRNVIGGTANTAALDLHHGLHVRHSSSEHFPRIFPGLVGDVIESAIDDALGNRLLARLHDHIDELRNILRSELRIRQDFTLGYFTTTRHDNLSLIFWWRPIRPSSDASRRTSNATACGP